MPAVISSSKFSPKLQTNIFTCWPATTWMFHTYFKYTQIWCNHYLLKYIPLTIFPIFVDDTTVPQFRIQGVILALSLFLTNQQSINNPINHVRQLTLNFIIQRLHFVFVIYSGIIYKVSLMVSLSLPTYLTYRKFIENELFNMPIILY